QRPEGGRRRIPVPGRRPGALVPGARRVPEAHAKDAGLKRRGDGKTEERRKRWVQSQRVRKQIWTFVSSVASAIASASPRAAARDRRAPRAQSERDARSAGARTRDRAAR